MRGSGIKIAVLTCHLGSHQIKVITFEAAIVFTVEHRSYSIAFSELCSYAGQSRICLDFLYIGLHAL